MAEVSRATFNAAWVTCYRCGMIFAMPAEVNARLRKSGKEFSCPAGHKQAYISGDDDDEAEPKCKRCAKSADALSKAHAENVKLREQVAALTPPK